MEPVETLPLNSVAELLSWSPAGARPPPRPPTPPAFDQASRSRRRLLVCHDMQGGYGQDRFSGGGFPAANPSPSPNPDADPKTRGRHVDPGAYTFAHWHHADCFVYFSHHLVTIPPLGWVRAANLHGTLVLGTLITEWDAGAAACAELFASEAAALRAAAQLAALALHHGFQGWLVNLENPLPPTAIPHVLAFLRELGRLMRAQSEHHLVIWYDAVTTEGRLAWQNALTPLNAPFFDACDGIFLNYTWRPDAPRASAAAAGPGRPHDVFLGVDVFGRNTTYGGGLASRATAEAAADTGVSLAVFAPGWSYESCPPGGNWRVRDAALWDGLATGWGLCPRPICAALPLETSFGGAAGRRRYHKGELVEECPWFDLALQQLTPLQCLRRQSLMLGEGGALEGLLLAETTESEAAWEGGTVLRIQGRGRQELQLFCTTMPVPEGESRVTLTCIFQQVAGACAPRVWLDVSGSQEGSAVQRITADDPRMESCGGSWLMSTQLVSLSAAAAPGRGLPGAACIRAVGLSCTPSAEAPAYRLHIGLLRVTDGSKTP